MASVNVQANLSTYIRSDNAGTNYHTDQSTWYDVSEDKRILFTCDSLPSNLRHYSIESFRLKVYANMAKNNSLNAYAFTSAFDPESVTWNTKPQRTLGSNGLRGGYSLSGGISDYWLEKQTYTNSDDIVYFLKYGGEIYSSSGGANSVRSILSTSVSPWLEVTYNENVKAVSKVEYKSGARSGYLNPRESATFQWELVQADSVICADNTFDQDSAVFYWKSNTDSGYTAVNISGNTKSVTIPANRFPTGKTISWYVQATDEDGTTTQTEVFSFSTSAAIIDAVCKTPVDTVEDGSGSIVFEWEFYSNDGFPASRTEVYWKKDTDVDIPANWRTLLDVSYTVTSITVLGGTFPAGNIDWKVIATNIDGVTGGSSSVGTARFISVSAPDAPQGLSATEVPFTTIAWQSGEQQAYQISIDGNVVKKGFGRGVNSWSVADPLSDGNHTVSVIVQGLYGFWSQPAEIVVTIQNTGSDDISLSGDFDLDANLLLETTSSTKDFYVYRDGLKIAHTASNLFIDRFALGNHSYHVIDRLPDGNYIKSNMISGTMNANGTYIALLNGSNWIDITMSENSATEQSFKYERRYSLRHVRGAVYPVLELAPYEDFAGSYEFACNDYATAKEFESFRGKEVIIKSRGGVVLFGAMVSLSSHYGDFINGFTFNIQRIHAEDYIDDTGT